MREYALHRQSVTCNVRKKRQTWETRTARKAWTPRRTCRSHEAWWTSVAAGPTLAHAPGFAGENLQRGPHRVIQLRGELGLERSQLSKLLLERENLREGDEWQAVSASRGDAPVARAPRPPLHCTQAHLLQRRVSAGRKALKQLSVKVHAIRMVLVNLRVVFVHALRIKVFDRLAAFNAGGIAELGGLGRPCLSRAVIRRKEAHRERRQQRKSRDCAQRDQAPERAHPGGDPASSPASSSILFFFSRARWDDLPINRLPPARERPASWR